MTPKTGDEPRLPADPSSAGPLPARKGASAPAASLTILAGFVGLAACLILFGSIAEGVRDQEVFALDTVATPFLHALASPFMDFLMNAATTAGSNLVIPPLFVIAVVVLVRLHRPGAALFLAASSGGSLLLNGLMKLFFQRARPQLPWANVLPDYSFPSGHTMNSVAFYLALAVIVWSIRGRRAGLIATTLAIILCVVIGISRIYLGYHYFTDVIGGFLAGASWVLICIAAFRAPPLVRFWPGASAKRSRDHSPPSGRVP
ncbi:MAG TPA: phosphatase PAP2 family protein [Candidatus Limnocylindrales bacterium]|nr:phosphatase PAP2 family protein [Candidatus Limnocylindrales bacterium]